MAQIPKCKHCKQEVLDKSQATKKGSYWYHNSCLEEIELAKKKYKPQENTPRRAFTDMVLDILAKVPRCSKRSTCTLADLISLNAVLVA